MAVIHFRARELSRWLFWDPRASWAAILGSLISLAVALLLPGPAERRVRIAGFIVTLLGVCLVLKEVLETSELFERPSIRTRVKAWLSRLPAILGKRNVVVVTGTAAFTASGGAVRVTVSHNPVDPNSWRSWVEALTKNLESTQQRITEESARLEASINSVRGEVHVESRTRESQHRAISERIETLSADGLDWTIVGAVWVVIGQLYGAFPQEIATLFMGTH